MYLPNMNALQAIKKRDLSFAYQIAVADWEKMRAMTVGQSADDIANGFHGNSLAGAYDDAERAVDTIAIKLDQLVR